MVTVNCARIRRRLKARYHIIVRRNGKLIYEFKRTRDLLVWRGQMVIANLLSQGALGTSTGTWRAVASENDTMPDMGDDSGDPINNEFSPLIGSLVDVTYDFNPTVKPSGGYQTIGDLMIEGTVVSDGSKTLRKIGIIDNVAVPNQNIIFEDAVIPKDVVLNDEILVRYTMPIG